MTETVLAGHLHAGAVGCGCWPRCAGVHGNRRRTRHGEVLAPTVQQVLADAGVDRDRLSAVAVGCGPAPYTSLRVGIMFAKAVGWALGIPVVGACSLDVIAQAVPGGEPFGVATDARRREVYWASYDARGCRLRGPLVGAPATVVGGVRSLVRSRIRPASRWAESAVREARMP